MNYATVPSICYTHPEVAQVGLTEDEAKKQGLKYKVGGPVCSTKYSQAAHTPLYELIGKVNQLQCKDEVNTHTQLF